MNSRGTKEQDIKHAEKQYNVLSTEMYDWEEAEKHISSCDFYAKFRRCSDAIVTVLEVGSGVQVLAKVSQVLSPPS